MAARKKAARKCRCRLRKKAARKMPARKKAARKKAARTKHPIVTARDEEAALNNIDNRLIRLDAAADEVICDIEDSIHDAIAGLKHSVDVLRDDILTRAENLRIAREDAAAEEARRRKSGGCEHCSDSGVCCK